MFEHDISNGCRSGFDFEDGIVDFLNFYGFDAKKTGKSDSGIDIVATSTIKPKKYSFNIQ